MKPVARLSIGLVVVAVVYLGVRAFTGASGVGCPAGTDAAALHNLYGAGMRPSPEYPGEGVEKVQARIVKIRAFASTLPHGCVRSSYESWADWGQEEAKAADFLANMPKPGPAFSTER